MLLTQFAGNAGRQKIRIVNPVMGLTIRRTGSVSITRVGLAAGLPEVLAMEITHPSRRRADGGDRLPAGMVALWGQFLRGPITETLAEGNVITTEFNYFLNEKSALELTSEDQCYVVIEPAAGFTYEIHAPESPVVAPYGQSIYNYELQRVPSDLREKVIYTSGCAGLILPNNPALFERFEVVVNLGDGGQDELPLSLADLRTQSQRANPFVSVLDTSTDTDVALTQSADYLLLSLNMVASVKIYNKLGAEFDFMLIRVLDRNSLG
jgi:hypothetical protein